MAVQGLQFHVPNLPARASLRVVSLDNLTRTDACRMGSRLVAYIPRVRSYPPGHLGFRMGDSARLLAVREEIFMNGFSTVCPPPDSAIVCTRSDMLSMKQLVVSTFVGR